MTLKKLTDVITNNPVNNNNIAKTMAYAKIGNSSIKVVPGKFYFYNVKMVLNNEKNHSNRRR